jgi:hypothetical protein
LEEESAMNGVAFFYCDGNSQYLSADSGIIFSSLLKQLISQCFSEKSNPSFVDAVKARFSRSSSFSRDNVLASLAWISQHFSQAFLVIDGVDECSDRERFSESLARLVERGMIKVLVASRPEHDIATAAVFMGKPILNIDDAVKDDISIHVGCYIEKDRKLKRLSPELKAEILRKMTSKCDGM